MSELTKRERVAATVIAVLIGGGTLALPAIGAFGFLFVVIGLGLGARKLVPRFWPTLGWSFLAGLIAGVVVLGPGLRLAMRVVAIVDADLTPEFSVGGTIGIIVGIGAMFGGPLGVVGILLRRGIGLGRTGAAALMAVVFMTFLLSIEDLREEAMTLGVGAWMNLPVFGLVALAYGLAAIVIYERLSRKAIQAAPGVGAMAS